MARLPNASALARRASVQVVGPPLTAAGLCALLNTLPEVATAFIGNHSAAEASNENNNDTSFLVKQEKARSRRSSISPLTLRIGNEGSDISQSLPFAMPTGNWVLIHPYHSFGEAQSQRGNAAGHYLRRHWNGEHAVIGLHDSVDTLRNALRAVVYGTSYYSSRCVIPGQELPNLSARQREVALLAAAGLSNAEIAQHLFVDITTVKTHLTEVYKKTGIRRRSQIIGQIGG